MARGDVITTSTTGVGAGAFTTFQPAAGDEWIVHMVGNDQHQGTAPNGTPEYEVSLYDGTNQSKLTNRASPRLGAGFQAALTNSVYLRVKNESGGTGAIGISGFKTKE